MPVKRKSYSDHPTTQDELGFSASVRALTEIINDSDLEDTPLTIGVFGPWGSGKTSLMKMLLQHLQPDKTSCLPIWFDAWRYTHEESLWRALLVCMVEGLREQLVDQEVFLRATLADKGEPDTVTLNRTRANIDKELDDLLASLYRNVDREELGAIDVDWNKTAEIGARLALRIGFSFIPILSTITKAVEAAQEKLGEGEDIAALISAFQRERSRIYRDQIRSLDQFQKHLRDLVKKWISGRGRKLVVFIDDLDRCLPEQAVGVLEAIKIFLDIPGCIFILGIDHEIIEQGIHVHYKEFALAARSSSRDEALNLIFPIAGRDYLDKIVQIPFELPPIEITVMKRFLEKRLKGIENLEEKTSSLVATIMSTGLLPNPRKIKRSLNSFRLLLALSNAQQRLVPSEHLAKMVVIQSSYPLVYDHIVRDPKTLHDLEGMARGKEQGYTSLVLAASMFPGDSPAHTYLTNVLNNFRVNDIWRIKTEEKGETKESNDKSTRDPIAVPSQLLTEILEHDAPRLRLMLNLEPSFLDLDIQTLERLVFLTKTTQGLIDKKIIASSGSVRLVATTYRLEK